ncbi:MAG: hypothetical protein ACM3O7_05115 [Acidobacteriota bacterium]
MRRKILILAASLLVGSLAWGRELTSAYVITAAANTPGLAGTEWHTDLTLYNPHNYDLPVVLYFLPSGRDNSGSVPNAALDVRAYETLNLWDVLGPDGFDGHGTGALLVYADPDRITCSGQDTSCDFAAFSRTYTLDPSGAAGEYGQAVPGFPAHLGLDWTVTAYLPQIIDDNDFRTNLGVASWTPVPVWVRVYLFDSDGSQIGTPHDHYVPAFGHIQWRMEADRAVTGGTVAFDILDGPSDAMVYPYASVVNWDTGDPINVEAQLTPISVSGQGMRVNAASVRAGRPGLREVPVGVPATGFDLDGLRARGR